MSALPQPDANIRTQIDAYHATLGPLLTKGVPYALIDFPDYSNIGDSAIYAGQLVYLDKHVGRRPSYVSALRNYDPDALAKTCPEGPILVTGGGNFGDIYPRHTDFRHTLWEHARGRQVIQLGQSIHFSSDAARDATARAIEAHGNFTLLVRDKPSFELAQKHFQCAVHLCPDGACNLAYLSAESPVQMPLLAMLRDDEEVRYPEIRSYLQDICLVDDWDNFDVYSTWDRRLQRRLFKHIPSSTVTMRYREAMYRRHALTRLRHGVEQLSRGEHIVTDRLHVHLISSLMGRRHIVLDNSYGKIGRYIDAWGKDAGTVQVTSLADLKAALETL